MKKLITALSILCLLTSQTKAEEVNKDTTKRFSIDGSLGTNVIFPFIQGRVGYRLPVADNNWEVNLSHSLNVTIGPVLYISTIGAKHYFANNNIEFLNFQSFLGAQLGLGYFYNNPPLKGVTNTFSAQLPVLGVGVGTDLTIIDNLQLSADIYAGFPFIVRPELCLKIRI